MDNNNRSGNSMQFLHEELDEIMSP